MYKLGFEEAEEPKIKMPTFIRSWKRQGSARTTSTSASLTMLKPLTMWITTHWDEPEGWYGKGGGRRVQDWEHTVENS